MNNSPIQLVEFLKSSGYISCMSNTSYFTIDFSDRAGAFCSYCGKKIVPSSDGDLHLLFRCDCLLATEELNLLVAKKQIEDNLECFYDKTHIRTNIIEMTARREAH